MDRRIKTGFYAGIAAFVIVFFSGCSDILFLDNLKEIVGLGSGVMSVKYNGSEVANGSGVNHGWEVVGTIPSMQLTFTIENKGVKELSNISVSTIPPYSNDYTPAAPLPTISSGGSTPFMVNFNPISIGDKSVVIKISSSDPGGDYTFRLSGRSVGWVTSSNTHMSGHDIAVNGNYAYIADDESGITIFDISNPINPLLKNSFIISASTNKTNVRAVSIYNNYLIAGSATIIAPDINFSLWDIGTILNPSPPITGSLDSNLTDDVSGIAVSGGIAYIITFKQYLNRVSLASPNTPLITGTYADTGSSIGAGVAVSGNFAYATFNTGGGPMLVVIDITPPGLSLPRRGQIPLNSTGNKIGIYSSYAYVTIGVGGYEVIDVSNPDALQLVATSGQSYAGGGIFISYPYAFIGNSNPAGIHILNISNPGSPFEIAFLSSIDTGELTGVAKRGEYLYASSDAGNIHVFLLPQGM